MLSNPSLGWQKLQDVYYSIRPCYDSLNWPIENIYSNYRVAISTQTTLIALASKFVPNPNVIDVYSISGTKLWSLVYNSSPLDHIVDFCFHNENLCVILSNQKFRLYSDFQGTFKEYPYTEKLTKLDNLTEAKPDELEADRYVITNLENNEIEEPFHVLETKTWGRFLVLRYRNRLTLTNLETFQNIEVPFGHLDPSKVNCMSLLSVDEGTLVCLLSYDETVYMIKLDFVDRTVEFIDEALTDGPFTHMSTSSNGALIALFNSKASKIFVIRKEFDTILLEYDTSNESSLPHMVEWAGNDAIILSLRDEIKLIGPGQKSISFFYDIIEQEDFDIGLILNGREDDLSFTIPIIKSEKDGLKIITGNKVEFLSRVPESSINLHLVGSSHPSSILLDCVDKLAQQSSKADTNISLLKSENSLRVAMKGCLDAALEEFSPLWQKKILKAVSFGKIYDNNYHDAEEYLKVLNTVKVLNQIRSPEVGIFLTYTEIMEVGWEGVIEMLLKRSQHLLALKVINLLDLQNCSSLVYVHWCCSKIKKELNMSDIELFKIISKKLLPGQGVSADRNYISVSQISDVAFQEGRVDLCKLLINLEPSILKKVNQFLKIEEVELALIKSFQTGDFDLCRLILLHLKDNLSLAQLFRVLNQNELKGLIQDLSFDELSKKEDINVFLKENLFISGDLIGNFWEQSIAKFDPKLLDSFYKHENKTIERSTMKVKEVINLPPLEDVNNDGTSQYERFYQSYKAKIQDLSNNRKLSKLFQEELEVLDLKRKLSETFQQSFFDEKSVTDIIGRLIKMHQLKPATKVVKDFKIPHEKLWNLVVEIYCKSGEFDRLQKFIVASNPNSPTWKSPIGFESIAETCMAYGCPKENVSNYIANCSEVSYTRRVDLFLQNGDFIEAAEEAFKNKDGELLQAIYNKAQNRDENIVSMIKNLLVKLGYNP